MGEVLYRKYRPKKLSEVVGQSHITITLNNAIKSQRIGHGYLFSGPRGVGKTSVARIFAYLVNNLKYGDKTAALDIIEIDAASNRRIDEIRELRDKIHNAPLFGEYKVYIIDEVHMLTREAFNALLKTLEEPPAHIIFILATTEPHKLPETIISRTQHFVFRPISKNILIKHLKNLAKKESLTITDGAIHLIAQYGRGSLRDSISVLDQLSYAPKIDEQTFFDAFGVPTDEIIKQLYDTTLSGDLSKVLNILQQALDDGISSTKIAYSLINLIVAKQLKNPTKSDVLFSRQLMEANSAVDSDLSLQLSLIDYTLLHQPHNRQPEPQSKENTQLNKSNDRIAKKEPKEPAITQSKKTITTKIDESQQNNQSNINIKEVWSSILSQLKVKYNTLYGIARMAIVEQTDNELKIKVAYKFHYKKINDKNNLQIISKLLSDLLNFDYSLKIELDPSIKSVKQPSSIVDNSNDNIDAIKQIFGGGEVLEA